MSNREQELERLLIDRDRQAAERELERLATEQDAANMLAAAESKQRHDAAIEQARRAAWISVAIGDGSDVPFDPTAIAYAIPKAGWPAGMSETDFGLTIAEQSTAIVSETHMGKHLQKIRGKS